MIGMIEVSRGGPVEDRSLSICTGDEKAHGQESDDLEPFRNFRHHMSALDVHGRGFGQRETDQQLLPMQDFGQRQYLMHEMQANP
jgi:hypothetical protein